MKKQPLCQYKHGSAWSKDYDSAGGKKKLCIYMHNKQQKKRKKKALIPPTPVPNPGEKRVMHFACKSIIMNE